MPSLLVYRIGIRSAHRSQNSVDTTTPRMAATTPSLRKCPIASTRVAAHPAASAYHSHRARGYNCANTAAPPNATST